MVAFQNVLATRNDLGQLASMQNKLVRIALERLRLSIKEFLNELPPEMDRAYAEAISAVNANSSRIFIPTRPSLLKPGESLRIFINVSGKEKVRTVKLLTRSQASQIWRAIEARHAGRNVYAVNLGPFTAEDGIIEYYATAVGESEHRDPPHAPSNVYALNILS
jgi:hypothetical protein